jgi:hypothetical protein
VKRSPFVLLIKVLDHECGAFRLSCPCGLELLCPLALELSEIVGLLDYYGDRDRDPFLDIAGWDTSPFVNSLVSTHWSAGATTLLYCYDSLLLRYFVALCITVDPSGPSQCLKCCRCVFTAQGCNFKLS